MEAVTLRPMTEQDAAQVAAIERACFTRPWSEQAFRKEAQTPSSHYFVACIGQDIIGFGGMQTVLDECSITNIAILKDFRGKGIGSRLMEALDTLAQQLGASFLTLEVRVSNQPALALYEKFGFLPVGIRKNYYALPTEDAVLMTKTYPERGELQNENSCH